MSRKEPDWLEIPRALIEQATAYLNKHGYADHDVYELAEAVPQENPAGLNRNQLMDVIDNRPNAEIVETARVICLAKEALSAWKQGNYDIVAEAMYYLGYKEAVAGTLIKFPSLSADMALDVVAFLSISTLANELYPKYRQQVLNLKRGQKIGHEKVKAARIERDKLICSIGLKYKNDGCNPRKITSEVLNHLARTGELEKFPPGELLSDKRFREILRDGEVIPPALKNPLR